jgi:hypothetical protein
MCGHFCRPSALKFSSFKSVVLDPCFSKFLAEVSHLTAPNYRSSLILNYFRNSQIFFQFSVSYCLLVLATHCCLWPPPPNHLVNWLMTYRRKVSNSPPNKDFPLGVPSTHSRSARCALLGNFTPGSQRGVVQEGGGIFRGS